MTGADVDTAVAAQLIADLLMRLNYVSPLRICVLCQDSHPDAAAPQVATQRLRRGIKVQLECAVPTMTFPLGSREPYRMNH
jgi:hypothetical protein